MALAISLQKLRFRDKEAEEENYGSHNAGKDAFLLKHGKVQRNLVEAGKCSGIFMYVPTQQWGVFHWHGGNGYSFNLTQCFPVFTQIATIFGDVQGF